MVGVTRPLTPAERQRLRTPANLWRALIPILLLVLGLVAWQRVGEPHSNGIHVVDTAAPVAAARQQAGFPLLLPSGLSDGWRPTSTEFVPAAQYSAASFRIGYVTPADKYAEFLESNGPADAVAAPYGVLTDQGSTTIARYGLAHLSHRRRPDAAARHPRQGDGHRHRQRGAARADRAGRIAALRLRPRASSRTDPSGSGLVLVASAVPGR